MNFMKLLFIACCAFAADYAHAAQTQAAAQAEAKHDAACATTAQQYVKIPTQFGIKKIVEKLGFTPGEHIDADYLQDFARALVLTLNKDFAYLNKSEIQFLVATPFEMVTMVQIDDFQSHNKEFMLMEPDYYKRIESIVQQFFQDNVSSEESLNKVKPTYFNTLIEQQFAKEKMIPENKDLWQELVTYIRLFTKNLILEKIKSLK